MSLTKMQNLLRILKGNDANVSSMEEAQCITKIAN
jgi:hypothetical protein